MGVDFYGTGSGQEQCQIEIGKGDCVRARSSKVSSRVVQHSLQAALGTRLTVAAGSERESIITQDKKQEGEKIPTWTWSAPGG